MTGLLLNLLLALAWVALSGNFSLANLVAGFVIGFLILGFLRRALGLDAYVYKVPKVLVLIVTFLWELLLANFNVAYHVITPRHRQRPGILALPLDVKSDTEITLLANMISLTPGTLSLHLSADRKVLYIHALDICDPETVKRKIKDGFERRVIEVMR